MSWWRKIFRFKKPKAFIAVSHQETIKPVEEERKVEVVSDPLKGVDISHNTTDDDALALLQRAVMDLKMKLNS